MVTSLQLIPSIFKAGRNEFERKLPKRTLEAIYTFTYTTYEYQFYKFIVTKRSLHLYHKQYTAFYHFRCFSNILGCTSVYLVLDQFDGPIETLVDFRRSFHRGSSADEVMQLKTLCQLMHWIRHLSKFHFLLI